MGGSNSGRWGNHTLKMTVEQCAIFDIRLLTRIDRVLRPRVHKRGDFWLQYFSDYGRERIVIKFELDTRNMNFPWLELEYWSPGGKHVTCPIALQIHYTWQEGLLWAFGCPIPVNGSPCNRRAAKLYLPPGGNLFGCRQCNQLTYTSSQTSHM